MHKLMMVLALCAVATSTRAENWQAWNDYYVDMDSVQTMGVFVRAKLMTPDGPATMLADCRASTIAGVFDSTGREFGPARFKPFSLPSVLCGLYAP